MVPRFGPSERSTPSDGMPLQRIIPATSKSQAPGVSVSTFSLPKVKPPFSDLTNDSPFGPAQTTYTSPFGPTAGMAPITVLLLSRQSPGFCEMRHGTENVLPLSLEREK